MGQEQNDVMALARVIARMEREGGFREHLVESLRAENGRQADALGTIAKIVFFEPGKSVGLEDIVIAVSKLVDDRNHAEKELEALEEKVSNPRGLASLVNAATEAEAKAGGA